MATIAALEPELGTELCRVKLEGGSLRGYRSEIIRESLTEREIAMLKCSRCNGIMKDASFTNNGEQMCLCCKNENEEPIPNSHLRNTILSLKCGCSLSKRGCEWLGRLESVEGHLTTCGKVYEACELKCGEVLTRDEAKCHVRDECVQRGMKCEHCEEAYKWSEMSEHVSVCGKVLVMCELGCGTCVSRDAIWCHLETECSEEVVVCPYEKYSCEVVGLKRRELEQHLEESRLLHTELKLNAFEEKFEISANKIDLIAEHFENLKQENELLTSKMEYKDLEIEILKEEVETLQDPSFRKVSKVKWSIKDILNKFNANLKRSYSEYYQVAGYPFQLSHSTDTENFMIDFCPRRGDNCDPLERLKAFFITRMISLRDPKSSLIYRSPVIIIEKDDYFFKRIASFPLSTDLKDFIKSDILELDVTVRILNNN